MKLLVQVSLLAFACLVSCVRSDRADWPELVLDERVLRISVIAADLSALAYATAEDIEVWKVNNETTGETYFDHPDYDEISFYTEEPDQAIVAKKEGRCYIAFRGTNANIDDWLQNAGLGTAQIFKDNDVESGESCDARGGFADFLATEVVSEGRAAVGACYETCEDKDDCLVITGHSQGGAISTVAAITLFSLNPIVVTFGQPPSIDADCPYVNNTRFYRYVNWIQDEGQDNDIGFDLVVFAPNWISGSVHYGYNILVGEDPGNVYYGGFGADIEFSPSRFDNVVPAHTMSGTDFSYQSRVESLFENLPNIRTDGSVGGTICEAGYAQLCQSNSCNENKCIPEGGVTETCIKNSCEQDSDCAGDLICIYDACATGEGEVQPGCPCAFSEDCENNDCIIINAFQFDFECFDPDAPSGVMDGFGRFSRYVSILTLVLAGFCLL